jgi:hypothetical protein
LQEHFREVPQEPRYDRKQSHPLAFHYDLEGMPQREVKMYHHAFHLSFPQLSFALRLRDKDDLQPWVLDLYLQGDAYCFHQILMKDLS